MGALKVHTRSTTERAFSLSKINTHLILFIYYCKIINMSELSNESLLEGAECAKLAPKEADRLFFQINSSIPDQDLRGVRKTEAVEAAIDMCRKCPVLKQCLEYALQHPESTEYGIWGGTTPPQRRRISRLGKNAIKKAAESAGK